MTEAASNEEPKEELSQEEELAGKMKKLDLILDIPLRVSVELAVRACSSTICFQLGQGSVIELNKLAGDPLEVLVNDKLIARGEVVVVNEKFGIRPARISFRRSNASKNWLEGHASTKNS